MSPNLAFLPNLTSALVLCLTFFYVWRVSGERYLFIWFLAALLLVGRYAFSSIHPTFWPEPPVWLIPASSLIRGGLFVWGGAEMVGRPIPRSWGVLALIAFGWMLGAPESVALPWTVFPAYLVFSGSLIWVAWEIGRHKEFPGFERALAAWPMAVYGVIQATFPWSLSALVSLAPTFYLVASITQLGFALGLLMVFMRTAEEEVTEGHARLSLALARALAGHVDMCDTCKSVRVPGGGWERVEAHVGHRSGTSFSHSICPACLEAHYGHVSRP